MTEKNYLIITEGAQDIEAIGKVLEILNYKRINKKSSLPLYLQEIIPVAFPFNGGDELKTHNFIPVFYKKDNKNIILKNATKDKLAEEAEYMVDTLWADCKNDFLEKVFLFADADSHEVTSNKIDILCSNLGLQKIRFTTNNTKIEITKWETTVSKDLLIYIFPDNQNNGTLEPIVIEGIKELDEEIHGIVETFINGLDTKFNLKTDVKKNKVLIDIVGGIKEPKGYSNSMHIKERDWISSHTKDLPLIKKLYDFLETHLN